MTIKQNEMMRGLRKRETYEELINYLLTDQEIIKYPDRYAKQIRESPYLTQLDGEGMRTMEQQQLQAMKEQEKENALRKAEEGGVGGKGGNGKGKGGGKGVAQKRAWLSTPAPDEFFDPQDHPEIYDMTIGDDDTRPDIPITYAGPTADQVLSTGANIVSGSARGVKSAGRLAMASGHLVGHVGGIGVDALGAAATGIGWLNYGLGALCGTGTGFPTAPVADYEPDLGSSSSSGLVRPAQQIGTKTGQVLPVYLLDREDQPVRIGYKQNMAQRAKSFLGGKRFRSMEERVADRRA